MVQYVENIYQKRKKEKIRKKNRLYLTLYISHLLFSAIFMKMFINSSEAYLTLVIINVIIVIFSTYHVVYVTKHAIIGVTLPPIYFMTLWAMTVSADIASDGHNKWPTAYPSYILLAIFIGIFLSYLSLLKAAIKVKNQGKRDSFKYKNTFAEFQYRAAKATAPDNMFVRILLNLAILGSIILIFIYLFFV